MIYNILNCDFYPVEPHLPELRLSELMSSQCPISDFNTEYVSKLL